MATNYYTLPVESNCIKLGGKYGRFCLPVKEDCTPTSLDGILTGCDERWNCNLCDLDSQYFIPYINGDKIMFQTQFVDRHNPMPSNPDDGWGTWVNAILVKADGTEITDHTLFASRYLVGWDGKKSYQMIEVDTSMPVFSDGQCWYIRFENDSIYSPELAVEDAQYGQKGLYVTTLTNIPPDFKVGEHVTLTRDDDSTEDFRIVEITGPKDLIVVGSPGLPLGFTSIKVLHEFQSPYQGAFNEPTLPGLQTTFAITPTMDLTADFFPGDKIRAFKADGSFEIGTVVRATTSSVIIVDGLATPPTAATNQDFIYVDRLPLDQDVEQVCTQEFRVVPECDEELTLEIRGMFDNYDCFGNYYGLPKAFVGNNAFRFDNTIRYYADLRNTSGNLTKEIFAGKPRRVTTQNIWTLTMSTIPIPPFAHRMMIDMYLAAPRTRIDGRDYLITNFSVQNKIDYNNMLLYNVDLFTECIVSSDTC